MGYELHVAVRYLKTKRRGLFTAITTAIGVTGVAIGVAAVLTTLSVMNGFQTDIKRKIVGAQSHVVVYARMDAGKTSRLKAALGGRKEIMASSPFVLGQAILTYGGRSMGIMLKGIEPDLEFKVNDLAASLSAGKWSLAERGKPPGIVLGEELARNLGAWIGDQVVILSPQGLNTPYGLMPALKRFTVAGVFQTGYYEYDSAWAYIGRDVAASFFKTPGGSSGFQVRLKDIALADQTARELQHQLGFEFTVQSFSQMNRTFFAALKLEKYVMFLLVTLITLVASLTIASNLILLGTEKLRDIGLLKAMGAEPGDIRRIFLWLGLMIGGLGVGLGVALGLGLCFIIHRYPIIELPADIYYLSRVPVRVDPVDLAAVVTCSLLLVLLATFYPAYRAAKTEPIEAIHYG